MNSSSDDFDLDDSYHSSLILRSSVDPEDRTPIKKNESLFPKSFTNSEEHPKNTTYFTETKPSQFSTIPSDKENFNPNFITPGGPQSTRNTNDDLRASFLWILTRLHEMGVKVKLSLIKRMVNSYAVGKSKEFILESILQNKFERDSDNEDDDEEDEDEDEQLEPQNYLTFTDKDKLNALERIIDEINDRVQDDDYYDYGISANRCQHCKKLLKEDVSTVRVFNCSHMFCHNCLLQTFKPKILDNEDIEKFCCPNSDCNALVVVDKFVNLIPEADIKDIGNEQIGQCSICFDDITGNEHLLKIFNCQEHFFCYACTLNYLKEAINNRKVLDVKCPDAICNQFLNDEKIEHLIPSYLLNRYLKYKKAALIERDPNVRWCSKPGCENLVKRTRKDLKAVCQCGQITCIGCGNPWHKKKTCEQALEKEYKLLAKEKDLQFCPECKTRVEKSTGCNHMTCPICTYEWCWLCGGEYSRGHYEEFNPLGCPGLMSGNNTRKKWSKARIVAYRFLLFLACIALAALAPVWIVGGAILLPNILYGSRYHHYGCKKYVIRVLLFILGLIFFPLTIVGGAVGAIVPGTCFLGVYLVKRCKKRSRAKKARRALIKNRGKKVQEEIKIDVGIRNAQNMRARVNDEAIYTSLLSAPLLREERNIDVDDVQNDRPLVTDSQAKYGSLWSAPDEYMPPPRRGGSIYID